jgi:tocopherol cyclase
VVLGLASSPFSRTTINNDAFTWPPHSGYHGGIITKQSTSPRQRRRQQQQQQSSSFFEGWYLRLVTQNQGSIALIFHVFDPNDISSKRIGVGMQVITPSQTISIESKDVSTFTADSHTLDVQSFFPKATATTEAGRSYFRLTTEGASGKIVSSADGKNNKKRGGVDFDFTIQPEVGWGTSERQYSVAGFLAAFPVFEPHYQVLLSRGRVPKGYLTADEDETRTTTYDLTNATMYLEKNWGGSFPSQWFWIQANTFLDKSSSTSSSSLSFLDLCVTSTGGLRRLPFFVEQEEEVALIAIHWNGKFLPFPEVEWSIKWGKWSVRGTYEEYTVQLEGTCTGGGFPVNCPTSNGMEEIALETFKGNLAVKLFERKSGQLVLHAIDNQACLEIGGLPWTERVWNGKSAMKEPIKSIAMNVGKS